MRLSLSPEPEEWQRGIFRFREEDYDEDDDDESDPTTCSDGDFVVVSKKDSQDNFQYSDSEEEDGDGEDDYPHPAGFPLPAHPSWGRTRFSLDPTITPDSIDDQWKSYKYNNTKYMQAYPPISSYVDPKTAPTSALLRYHDHNDRKQRLQQENDKEMDQLAQLLQAASIVDNTKFLGAPQRSVSSNNETPLAVLADTANRIQQQIQAEQRTMEQEHMEAAKALKMLLQKTQNKADRLLLEEKQREEEDEKRREKEKKEEHARIKAQQHAQEAKQAELEKKQEHERNKEIVKQKARAAVDAEEAAKTEYIVKAKKLVLQLTQLRESIEPFEKSKDVSKRRLNMKKVIRLNVNTLSENSEKIRTVAANVGQAISAARAEDAELKQQQEAGNTQITPEMTRGKRYLLDLLASDVMKRVQAEGFNGLRGDGFPISHFLAIVSIENRELIPIMAAHIYTVCPTAIPKLPTPKQDASEDDLMKSLGMSKGKDGEYENFSRFLLRTEGIISLVADVMASNPPNHQLLGGHKGAVDWLTRFLGLVPAPPQKPLPLLTAPVLNAFLVGAGHMLANKHPDEFKAHMETIEKEILDRLDGGAIGEPSAIRLKKTMKEGFEGFKNNLPHKALPDLYNGSGASGGDGHGLQQSGGGGMGSSPYGGGTSSSVPPPNPFGGGGGSGGAASSVSNPFGGGGGNSSVAPTPFGGSATSGQISSMGSTNNPFSGGASNSDPFGGQGGGGMGGNASSMQDDAGANQASNPFGAPANNATPFGGQPQAQPSSSPFGAPAQQSTPFGQPQSASTPFGAPGGSSNTPFGNPAQQSSPFGQPQAAQSPFGAPGGSSNTPFGGSANNTMGGTPQQAQNSPFGGNMQQQPTPFGQPQSSSSPFGAPGSTPTPFGKPAQQPTPFGQPQSSQTPFGAPGGSSNNPFGGGAASNSTPFGGSGNQMGGTPFGSQQQSAPFGASPYGNSQQQQSTPFRGGGGGGGGGPFGGNSGQQGNKNKPPCKFFAQGRCKFGANCRFSHG